MGLVVLTGSACVTPTHASSANSVIFTHIQAASTETARDELVAIYNNGDEVVDITNWCIRNKSFKNVACFTPLDDPDLHYYLPPYSRAVVASEPFMNNYSVPYEHFTKVFLVISNSIGSIVSSNDNLALIDANGQVVDTKAWPTAAPTGQALIRLKSPETPYLYQTLDPFLDWEYAFLEEIPTDETILMPEILEDPEGEEDPTPLPDPDPDPEQDPEPDPETDPDPDPTPDGETPPEVIHPIFTELLPDAEGSDTGNEFIELYNPGDVEISLNGYKLRVGPNLEKSFSFPSDVPIPARGYTAFTNSQINFSLLNSSSKVQLEYNGQLIGEPVIYTGPKAGKSWALVHNQWVYTVPTPGSENISSTEEESTENNTTGGATTSTLKPCAANQYRSPETNRCRLLVTAKTAAKAPCKPGQYRNPETGRCRNIASASSTAKPCKEGQERNPETNRCRNVAKMTKADYGVKPVEEPQNNTAWYGWLGIGLIVVLILGYAVWEWREEIKNFFSATKLKFARSKA